jgi:uncharacterized protein (TIGR02145 family)
MKIKLLFLGMLATAMLGGCNEEEVSNEYNIIITCNTGGTAVATVNGEVVTKTVYGNEVIVTATPDEGYLFVKWTSDEDYNGQPINTFKDMTVSPFIFNKTWDNGDRDFSIKAEFTPIPQVEGGAWINGVVWANCNVDIPGKFASNPESVGMFYRWNERTAWSTADPRYSTTDGTTFSQNTPWDWTDSHSGVWVAENDPCPDGWRVASHIELYSLLDDAVLGEWVDATSDSPSGYKFTDKMTSNSVFFPALGRRCGFFDSSDAGTLSMVGSGGFYWHAENKGTCSCLAFDNSEIELSSKYCHESRALSVRCVAE